VPYYQVLSATGTTPLTWSVVAGSLPGWASLNPLTGEITGTPKANGTALFVVEASNGGGVDDKALSIAVPAPVSVLTGKSSITGSFSLSRH
jgi:hypothetical protein